MRNFLVLAVVLAGFLIWKNPPEEKFETFVEDRIEKFLNKNTDDSVIGSVISGLGARITGQMAQRATRRQNFLLFSVYTVHADFSDEGESNQWKFLGIADRFIEIESPESSDDE